MGDLRKRITEDEGSLQRLAAYIPGFIGYRERQIRRKADQLLRDYLVGMIDDIRQDIDEFLNRWTREHGLAELDDIDRVRRELGKVRDKVRFADYGYTGWFDAVKIKEDELDALYDYDLAMREQVVRVGKTIQALVQAAPESVQAAIREALAEIDCLGEQVEKRDEITTGLIPE